MYRLRSPTLELSDPAGPALEPTRPSGRFGLPDCPPDQLAMSWSRGADQVRLVARPAAATYELSWTDSGKWTIVPDVALLPY